MNLESQIRKLARSNYYQEIYNASKECSGIRLFDNSANFSGPQYLLLYWLRVYSMVYDERYQLEWENLDDDVIKDNDRLDAFLYWRRKEQEKKLRKYKEEQRKSDKKTKGKSFPIFSGAKNKSKDKS